MAGTLPPLFEITADDHGGYGAVAVYTLLALTVVIVSTRLSTRWFIGRVVHPDDILLGISLLLGIIQSVLAQLAISNGLGRRLLNIGDHQLEKYLKYEYAAQILLIATIAFSKLSLGLLFKNLMTSRRSSITNQTLMGVIIAWALASIIALALRCSMPTPWKWDQHDQCINQAALFQAIAAFNILTDIALVVLPCLLLRNVQLTRLKRFRIMALLASRFLVCIAAGIEIKYTVRMLNSPDIPWANTNSTIWDQTMMNLSIITTALPSLGRLVIELQPSIHAFTINDDPNDIRAPGGGYNFSSMGKSMDHGLKPGTSVQVTSGWRESLKDDGESTEGLVTGADQQNVIQQTIHFEVH
ncbi:uncharacterized protein N7473_005347 [Penicillium subrubescens]|uniref:Rhodopsin domain-containing protein n=1 Tax=Penicillium subrubescens TaxID=1316194 RepID=A0A1Q5UM26_9EURO|nr:uncharacterized protein N7473_005347 [Penicillium subrubescens]KAJ5895948.1 hypothetical protein N7473_005347 [Penicillium subrubescens]OKP13510.1 hypothetical protein PENSUB_701 [Penicillium subrubescens]